MKLLSVAILVTIFASSAFAQFGGTGADGPLTPTSNITLDTDPNDGVFNFTSIVIPAGVTVTVSGSNPARLLATGNVVVVGEINVSPGSCGAGGAYSPGYVSNTQTVASATHAGTYGSNFAALTIGGSHAFTNNAGGALGLGGGFFEISSFGTIQVTGSIRANGHGASSGGSGVYGYGQGSGGTLVLRSMQNMAVSNTGLIEAKNWNGNGDGLIRFETPQSVAVYGTVTPPPIIDTPERILGHMWSVSQVTPFVLTESDSTGVLTTTSTSGAGYGVCTTLRGARWVTFPASNEIHPYGRNGQDLLPGKTYATGPAPRGIAADRYGYVWVACLDGLHKHDSWGQTMLTVPLTGNPWGVAVDAQGQAWMTSETSGMLHCVTEDGTIIGSYPVGTGPRGIAIDRHGDIWISLTNGAGATQGSVAKVDAQGNVLFTVSVDAMPLGIACDVDDRAWVACEGDLINPGSQVFRISTDGSQVTTHPVGTSPTSVSMLGDGSVWIVNSGNLVSPSSSLEQLNPVDGMSLGNHALPDLSIAFGDSTGYGAALAFDHFGDVDGDGDPNLQEMLFSGDIFDPNKQSNTGSKIIDSVSPVTGMLAGGTPLTIKGGPFTYSWGTTVTVGGIVATNIDVVDTSTITCETAASPLQGRVDVNVTDVSGSATASDAFVYSNIGLFPMPSNASVASPGVLTLTMASHPFTPVFLLVAPGVGVTPIGTLILELPMPITFILNAFVPIPMGTAGNGELVVTLVIPSSPQLVGQQFSFVSAILDQGCNPEAACASNGVVLTIQ